MPEKKKKVFSAVRPTNILHIGNYLGSIRNWVAMQEEYDCTFSIVDYHAITTDFDKDNLREHVFATAALYLASGLDPNKCRVFVQSRVPEHTELTWILNCITPVGDLKRMVQFKEKSADAPQNVNMGLFDYPVLMAADIILYDADLVPVGEDQTQHVELARSIAHKFNVKFGQTFVEAEALVKEGGRVMSLDNPEKKMAKSADSTFNYISLLDSPDVIKKKIAKAVTDSGTEITFDKSRPAVTNLLTIYQLMKGITPEAAEKENAGKKYVDFKNDLAEVIISVLAPIQEKYNDLMKNPAQVSEVLDAGATSTGKQAAKKIEEVREKIGVRS